MALLGGGIPSGLRSDHLFFAVSVLWCYVRGFVFTARHVRIVTVIVSPPSSFLRSLAHLVSHLILVICFAVPCQSVVVIPIALTVIVYIAHLSCLAKAPVPVTASLSSAPPMCIQIPIGFLRHPPSLGLCGLVSGLLTLLLGVASYLGGFISSAAVAACSHRRYPPICVVEDFMSALIVHGSTHLLFRKCSVQ